MIREGASLGVRRLRKSWVLGSGVPSPAQDERSSKEDGADGETVGDVLGGGCVLRKDDLLMA